METMKIGDKIIYPNQGLGVIEGISKESYNGEFSEIIHLRIIANNTLVQISRSTATEIGIRRPISEGSIKKIFDYMRNGAVDVSMDWKGRYKEHVSRMKSGTLSEVATVLKSLYYLSLIKPLSFREKKMMEKAKELIVCEISEAADVPCSKIEQKLLDTLARCFKDAKPRVAS
jgi:CarD family transcriptional regulator